MFYIEQSKCVGCGTCVDSCPQQAVSIENNVAVINQSRCRQCGYCALTCPVKAVYEAKPVYSEQKMEVETVGYERGFGFQGVSPPWPYVGRGRGGLPRCQYYGGFTAPANVPVFSSNYSGWDPQSSSSRMSKDQELVFLKEATNALRRQQEEIEARLREIEAKK